MNPDDINEICLAFLKNNEDPKIELNFINDFTLLLAIVLSAQSTDKMVNKITQDLFIIYHSPEKIVSLGYNNLVDKIHKIGLYKTKAKNIIELSRLLIEKYQSKVPLEFEKLIQLPGVGRKTANVFLNTFTGAKLIGVDRHVHKVANRIGLVSTNNVLNTEKELYKIIPQNFIRKIHHWLVLHGRYICTTRYPKCQTCFISDKCEKNI